MLLLVKSDDFTHFLTMYFMNLDFIDKFVLDDCLICLYNLLIKLELSKSSLSELILINLQPTAPSIAFCLSFSFSIFLSLSTYSSTSIVSL